MLVGRKWISTAAAGVLAAGLAAPASAQAPAGANQNQATAEAVAAALRSSPALAGYRIEIQTRDGRAILSGAVATPAQKSEAIARVMRVRGVGQRGRPHHGRQPTRASCRPSTRWPAAGACPASPASRWAAPAWAASRWAAPGMAGQPMGGPAGYGGAPGAGGPIVSEGGPVSGEMMDGPAPEGPAGAVSGTQASLPGQPNYAWPSTAPYPNFSAVGYPTAYPWQAWPNIGPPYPYPEVPLDWRAVTLRWDDGIWWLDFKKHYTRPFFTPYPFGIFAY